MAVTFVIGRAGSGKTRRCFDAIVDAMRAAPLGPPIYWLLPRQATFNAERDLTCNSGLPAFCRAHVVSFDQFGQEVFAAYGGSSIPQVTSLGRRMIIGHLLRQKHRELRFYAGVAGQRGLAAELETTFAELERSGKDAADLRQVIEDLSCANVADIGLAALFDKLRDVRLLYDAYLKYLGQERLDQHRRGLQVQAALSGCSFLRESAIYVDGFADFTENERRILTGAARAGARIEITLLIDPRSPTVADPNVLPDEMSLFRRTEATYRKLHFAFTQENVVIAPPVRLEEVRYFRSAGISELERSLFKDPVTPCPPADGIELIEAPDRRCEVDAVARQVRQLLAQGLRMRQVGVLVRDFERYHGLIEASFAEHGVPYFVDRRRPASHHPLLEFVRCAFAIATNDWPHDAVMTLTRGGLAGIDLYDADGLENYVVQHRIEGDKGWESPDRWGYRRRTVAPEDSEVHAGDAARAENLRRRLLDNLAPFLRKLRCGEALSVREVAAEVLATLERFGVRERIGRWMRSCEEANELERRDEHEQVWTNLIDLFEQMVDLLGDECLTPAEFNDVLEAGLESFDLAVTPPMVDQVLVGQIDRTRSQPLRAVFVMDMVDGEFPRPRGEQSILTDRDRRTLRQRRIDLDPGERQQLLDERFLGYVAFTRASERLYVSRPLADDEGKQLEPSSFWRRIEELFPNVRRTSLSPPHEQSPGEIATPRQLVASLMRWVRRDPDPVSASPDMTWPALYHWMATRADCDDAIGTMRRRAWRGLSYTNQATLSADVARELHRSPLHAGVRQLEDFAACPFSHFARYALALHNRQPPHVTPQDLGLLYHELLERAMKDVMRRRTEGDRSARMEQVIDRLVLEIGATLRGELMIGSARNRYLLDRANKTSHRVALAQREMLKRGSFRPTHAGVTFGPDGDLPPLPLDTPAGNQVLLHGKIDRVDRTPDAADVAVIDYRLSEASLPIGMVMHGLSLQLLSQLLVLEAHGKRLSGIDLQAAAAFYLPLVRKIKAVAHPDEATDPADPKWHLSEKPRGLFDRRCLSAFDKDLQDGRSDVVQAFVKKDGALGFRGKNDAAESDEFRKLLEHVSQKLAELADGILGARIDITPYRLNDRSPCPQCEFRALCRFDPAINRYNHLANVDETQTSAPLGNGGSDA